MDALFVLLALCEGNHRFPVDSPQRASDAELWYLFDIRPNIPLKNGGVAGDLGRHEADYDVTVIEWKTI